MEIIINSTSGNEPVTRAEAKTWLRLDSDLTADDDIVDMLISDARIYAEFYTSRFYKDANISIKVLGVNSDDTIDLVGKADASSVEISLFYDDEETELSESTFFKVSETQNKIELRSGQTWGNFDYMLITYDVVNESTDQIKKCILNQVNAEYDWRKDGKIVNRTKINAALDQTRDFKFK